MPRHWLLPIVLPALVFGLTAAMAPPAHADPKVHKLSIQVDVSDPAVMNMSLNNAMNAVKYFKERGETVQIEFVAFGPGLHMLRADTSPVKEHLADVAAKEPTIRFSACANTRAGMQKAEGKEIPLLPQAVMVPAGVTRLMELQELGWTYIRP